jgi:hypothetical protein
LYICEQVNDYPGFSKYLFENMCIKLRANASLMFRDY